MINWRLRAYLGVICARHILMGILFIFDAERYEGLSSFITLFQIATPTQWGYTLIALGIYAGAVTIRPTLRMTRWALYAAVFMSVVWAASFLFSRVEIASASFLLLVLYGALAAKDFLVCTTVPYRVGRVEA